MSKKGEASSSQGQILGSSRTTAGPSNVVQPPARHTSSILDPRGEEYISNRKDPKGEEKVDDLGKLKGGRQYVCEAFYNPGSTSQRLFFSAKSCAQLLGYSNAESMVRDNPSLFLLTKSTPSDTEPDDDKLVSSLSMFRQFGHKMVKRGRAVFDDYFETAAREQGVQDNTLWAAVGEDMPDEKALEILRHSDIDNVYRKDSTGLPMIDAMIQLFFERLPLKEAKAQGSSALELVEELAEAFGQIVASDRQDYAQKTIHKTFDPYLSTKEPESECLDALVHRMLRSAVKHWSPILGTPATDDITASTDAGTLVAEWKIPDVVEQITFSDSERGKPVLQVMSEFVVISGSGSDYECAQCIDIIIARWGQDGYQSLLWICEIVDDVLNLGASDTIHSTGLETVSQNVDRGLLYSANRSSVVLTQLNIFERVSKSRSTLIEVVSWLCAAFRQPEVSSESAVVPTSSQIFMSRTCQWQLSGHSERSENWFFLQLRPLKPTETTVKPDDCWKRLFSSATIVEIDLKPRWGRGLRISFDLMSRLAAIQNAWHTPTSMVLFGFFTALIPTKIDTWGSGIQWHLECRESQKGMLLPKDLDSFPGIGLDIPYDESDIGLASISKSLEYRDCFIGWHPNANIMLGTERLVDGMPPWDWTHSLRPVHQKLETSGYEKAGQIGVEAGPVTLTAVATQQRAYVPYKVRFEPSSDYQTALLDQEGKSCLLIDNEAEQAWIVPLLSVLLHLCHRYGQLQSAKGRRTKIPFATESPSGDHAVRAAIKDSGRINIFESDTHGQVFLSELFHSLLFGLKMVELPDAEPSRIFATEVMDIVTKRNTSPKEIPCNGVWSHLVPFASLVDIVAVAEGIGHAIRPLSEQSCTCTVPCHELPEHRGYLAAHVAALESLNGAGHSVFKLGDAVGKGKSQLTPEACWVPQHDPWMWSAHDRATCHGVWMHKGLTERIVQRTISNRKASLSSQESLSPILTEIPRDGVIVFGTRQIAAEPLSHRNLLPRILKRLKAGS